MAPKKKQTAKKKMKEAVKKSVARSQARAKQSAPGDALLVAMGKAALNLARIQDQMTQMQRVHDTALTKVRQIRQQLEKRGDGK